MTAPEDWCEQMLGYQFSDIDLLKQALTHRSASGPNNERLEFLGDAVLGLVIANAIYLEKTAAPEGALSRFRSGLVRRETLVDLARELNLGQVISMGSGERRSGGHQRQSVLANALEAIFGAILLDGGYNAAKQTILGVYSSRLVSLPAESELKDAKTRLQEWLQARRLPPPEYPLLDVSGADHARTFTVSCRLPALDLETNGSGTSRRRAEQAAAIEALEQLPND